MIRTILAAVVIGLILGMAVTNAFARAAYDVANPQMEF